MTHYKDKYRIESTRLHTRDYGADGFYFVTICTENRECFFGDVVAGEMRLSDIGTTADAFWAEIPDHFDNALLDEYVIMPNHVHGIIVIENDRDRRPPAGDAPRQFGPLKSGSLSSMMQSYKAAVTRWCRKNGFDYFAWQPRYYDHIIRNQESLDRIRAYIVNNPLYWEKDRNHPSRLDA